MDNKLIEISPQKRIKKVKQENILTELSTRRRIKDWWVLMGMARDLLVVVKRSVEKRRYSLSVENDWVDNKIHGSYPPNPGSNEFKRWILSQIQNLEIHSLKTHQSKHAHNKFGLFG